MARVPKLMQQVSGHESWAQPGGSTCEDDYQNSTSPSLEGPPSCAKVSILYPAPRVSFILHLGVFVSCYSCMLDVVLCIHRTSSILSVGMGTGSSSTGQVARIFNFKPCSNAPESIHMWTSDNDKNSEHLQLRTGVGSNPTRGLDCRELEV